MCAHYASSAPGGVDVLIVGQGIAGSLLAWVLHQRGLRVLIVDDGHKSSASMVAAGMINPVQGRRLNTIWQIERSLPAAIRLYREIEAQTGNTFFFPKKIFRLIRDSEQAAILLERSKDPAFSTWLDTPPTDRPNAQHSCPSSLAAPYGCVGISGGGYLDTQNLLRVLREYFRQKGCLIEAQFACADLNLSNPHSLQWHNWQAKRIVFAEGWRTLHNPFFADHTFFATKGQILTVQTEQPLPEYVVNRGKWLVPLSPHSAWVGATYERNLTDSIPTTHARREILAEVQGYLTGNHLKAQEQRAGVRLAAPDHIPRIGFLASDSRIGLFSAFSSKGNCLAPYLAHCMAEHILCAAPLPPKADIAAAKNSKTQKRGNR